MNDEKRIVIKTERVTKQYVGGSFTAVDEITIDLVGGEIIAFIGPSGCGKTTMLRMIAGLEYPTHGNLSVYNENVKKYLPIHGPGPDRGMIFQAYTSFPWLNVLDNIEYGMKITGVPKDERRAKAEEMLKLVHLEDFKDYYPASLSGGMKQRVAIARTLAQNPAVILMDEPFGALDAQVRWEMQEMMIDVIHQKSKTVILVTHDIQEAIYLSDRIIFYTRNPGKVKANLKMDFKKDERYPVKESCLTLPGYMEVEKELFSMMREEITN